MGDVHPKHVPRATEARLTGKCMELVMMATIAYYFKGFPIFSDITEFSIHGIYKNHKHNILKFNFFYCTIIQMHLYFTTNYRCVLPFFSFLADCTINAWFVSVYDRTNPNPQFLATIFY